MEIIEFAYRGRVIRVTPETEGWLAHIKCPEAKILQEKDLDSLDFIARGYSPDGFYPLAYAGLLNSASDAVVAAMNWVDTRAVVHCVAGFLDEQRRQRRLPIKEWGNLIGSVVSECKKGRPHGERL